MHLLSPEESNGGAKRVQSPETVLISIFTYYASSPDAVIADEHRLILRRSVQLWTFVRLEVVELSLESQKATSCFED
jgi:hypothetical protein